jgi:hypothetical protein
MQEQTTSLVDATDRYVFFNESLAQAYDALFPGKMEQTGSKGPRNPSRPTERPEVSANRFEVLSNLIEQEPCFDESTSLALQEQNENESEKIFSATTKPSSVEDDPLNELLSICSYILEMDILLAKAQSLTKAVTEHMMPLSLVGTLLGFVFQNMTELKFIHELQVMHHKELIERYANIRGWM